MKRALSILLLTLCASAAHAQDSADAFQQRAFDTATVPGGDTHIPILCRGFYLAIDEIAPPNPNGVPVFRERAQVARNIGVAVRMMDMAGTDTTLAQAEAFIDAQSTAVTAVFRDWLAFNDRTEQQFFTDALLENAGFCNTRVADWTGTPAN